MKTNKGLLIFYLILSVFLLIVTAILIYPMVMMVISSFCEPGNGLFTIQNYIRIFTEYQYVDGFANSVILSLYSSIFGLLITVLATYGIHAFFPRLNQLFISVANLTANYVGVPLSFGLILLMGNAGLLINLARVLGWDFLSHFSVYSVMGLRIAFVYFQIPLGITLLLPIYHALDVKWREAAVLLGARNRDYWLKIGLPILAPSLIGVFSMMFANGIGTYDTAVALTGSSVNMISINIANTIQGDIFAQPEIGSAVAVVLGSILMLNMLIGQWLQKRGRRMAGQ
ncbi:ABC transporter permease subunit [Streptococcus merionis]|uniref:ABC transporter permease n=1 Tax=Streptococcus merionis TaxID=400065 RepID=UPI0026EAB771|nr:ABC transporter permease [Streptococcus merionis]